eukprot:CAMPEP_0169085336 /NCGR_PEP_ID=MMETSP1015-20121227/13103_1 /TAXON_ID=342587 /ORGANISM="Karlodinium micrum, Strain CCMP2283" /LENGTH=208 /DNA_ID=CAMNT_0009145411 /DNA_START=74 /DNA_END=697 /DNA_ORIENTATION=+
MSLQRELIKSLAAAGFVSFHCCLSSEHPLAPSSTTVIAICAIQLLSLLSALAGFPLTGHVAKSSEKGRPPTHNNVTEAVDSVTIAIKNAWKSLAQNAALQLIACLLVIVVVVRMLRVLGYFKDLWHVVLVAFPLGGVARNMMGDKRSEKIQRASVCSRCGDVDCDGSPDQCPSNEDFWSVCPKTEHAKDEVDMTSLLGGDWADKVLGW